MEAPSWPSRLLSGACFTLSSAALLTAIYWRAAGPGAIVGGCGPILLPYNDMAAIALYMAIASLPLAIATLVVSDRRRGWFGLISSIVVLAMIVFADTLIC